MAVEFLLLREYHEEGTNGEVWCDGEIVCLSIELPWLQNQSHISCIPEGRYRLVKRFTPKRGWHLMVQDVENRNWILFHTASIAKRDLLGCIAPVLNLTGPGKGNNSKPALTRLEKIAFAAFVRLEEVFITIKEKQL